jgi:molecular chaperone GrpE (heat shock protein)
MSNLSELEDAVLDLQADMTLLSQQAKRLEDDERLTAEEQVVAGTIAGFLSSVADQLDGALRLISRVQQPSAGE